MHTRTCSGISSVDVDEVFIDFHGFSTSLAKKIIPSLTSYPDGPLHLSGSLLSRCCPACHRHPPSLHRLPVKCHFEDWIPDGHVEHWASNPIVESKIHGHVSYFCCSYWSVTGFERLASAGRQCLLIALDRLLLQLGRNWPMNLNM